MDYSLRQLQRFIRIYCIFSCVYISPQEESTSRRKHGGRSGPAFELFVVVGNDVRKEGLHHFIQYEEKQ